MVFKSERKLFLLKEGEAVKSYHVSLGFSPIGAKVQEGDGKTPEGIYFISYKNPQSKFHLSLGLSYPDQNDIDYAYSLGVKPGGNIMIHGFPNDPELYAETLHNHMTTADWTSGCISVTDSEIEEIYNATMEKVEVEICP